MEFKQTHMKKMKDMPALQTLEENLNALFKYVDRVRIEIATLNKSGDGDDKFMTMSKQLDGVVEATKDASERIMDAVENSNAASDKLREALSDPAQLELLDRVIDSNNVIFEACAFQDLTGQRVTKIVKSVSYVEERVTVLRAIWGTYELDEFEMKQKDERTADEKLLNGPQMIAEAISQDEIDKLFD
jgi:chemotaxis protein CheZ